MSDTLTKKIFDAKKDGRINEYMAKKILETIGFGVNEQLLDDAISDAEEASGAGIDNDKDYILNFNVSNIIEDIMQDTFGINVGTESKKEICNYILKFKNDPKYDLTNLTDLRILVYSWLRKSYKKAYPNISGKTDREIIYDLNKWVLAVKTIYSMLKEKGISKQSAIDLSTADWDSDEKFKFINWLKYYEEDSTEKYNIKIATLQKESDMDQNFDVKLPSYLVDSAERSNQYPSTVPVVPQKTEHEQKLEDAERIRNGMKGRIRSLWKLLDRYNHLMPSTSVDRVYRLITELSASISKLNSIASMVDCMIRTANQIRKEGFSEGADLLIKTAEDPMLGQPVTPDPISAPTAPPAPRPGVSKEMIINKVEAISKLLKSRDLIRELASVDILLNELGLASYFPELGDSQSKLNEAYSYASNKVEGVISKLRGTNSEKPAAPVQVAKPPPAQAPAEELDASKLHAKPVGKVKSKL